MEFYIDENLTPLIARLLRDEHGIGATDWKSERMQGKPDAEQLAFAASRGFCLVTRDEFDFIPLTERCRATGAPHAGVIVVRWRVRRADTPEVAALLAELAWAQPDGLEAYTMLDLFRSKKDA